MLQRQTARSAGTAALSSSCHVQGGEKQGKVSKLAKTEVLMLNIGSMCTGARVIAVGLLATSQSASHPIKVGRMLCILYLQSVH